MAERQSTQETTKDQLGNERDPVEVMEAKAPLPQDDVVPGVRGLVQTPLPPESVADDKDKEDIDTWGGEGGAGVYPGAPAVSDVEAPPERATPWARAESSKE